MGERMQLRRRLRQQRRAREAMLLDLGALVYELHRQGRRAPELLQQKAAELEVVDGEVRELEDALAGIAPEGPAAGEAQLLEEDALGEEEWVEEELGEDELGAEAPLDDEELDEDAPLDDEELDDEAPLDDEEPDDEALLDDEAPLDELDEDDPDEAQYEDDLDETALHAEPAPTVEVDALDDDPRSAGEARS